jgi:hypothetical protein
MTEMRIATGQHSTWKTTDGVFEVAREIGVATLAGAAAGFLAAGVGGRLAMRVSGFMFAQDHPNRLAFAESGAKVGEITADGTIFLLFFGTLMGVAGAYIYATIKPWLPGRAIVRGFLFGLVALALLSAVSIDRGNDDFQRLGSVRVNVLIFASLFLIYGVLIALFESLLAKRLPMNLNQMGRGIHLKTIVAYAFLIGGIVVGLIATQVLLTVLVVAFLVASSAFERLQLSLIMAAALILFPAYLLLVPLVREHGYRFALRERRAVTAALGGGMAVILIASTAVTAYSLADILSI